jgi:hypothetical protein
MRCSKNKRDENKRKIRGTSYIPPVKRENEKISSFVKTASYKTLLILGTLLPSHHITEDGGRP